MTAPRHFLDLSDAGGDAIAVMLTDAIDRKRARADWPKGRCDSDAPLAGRVLAAFGHGLALPRYSAGSSSTLSQPSSRWSKVL